MRKKKIGAEWWGEQEVTTQHNRSLSADDGCLVNFWEADVNSIHWRHLSLCYHATANRITTEAGTDVKHVHGEREKILTRFNKFLNNDNIFKLQLSISIYHIT